REFEERTGKAAPRLDEREEALRCHVEALEDTLHEKHHFANERVRSVRVKRAIHSENALGIAARLERDDADLRLIETKIEQRIVEFAH
ncbi:hypothetical protein ACO1K8_14625, partial [Staphylococcus aureus]